MTLGEKIIVVTASMFFWAGVMYIGYQTFF